jgi:hypothetical protein
MDFGIDPPFAKNRTMRRLILLMLLLSALTGCHGAGAHALDKQRPTASIEPDRRETADTMRAAQAEASQQLKNW